MQSGLTEPSSRTGIVLSDLHLFARRSRGVECLAELASEFRRADVIVLNGDTFDFRWSTKGDVASTQTAALNWLRELTMRPGGGEVHFVLGNHDCVDGFPAGLENLSRSLPRFHWHEYWLRLGKALFLHGDCSWRRMDGEDLRAYRARWGKDSQRGNLAAAAYEWADHLGFTGLAHAWQFPRRTAVERIAYHLDRTQPRWRERIRDCYFGHTHRPFSNYRLDGINFHNTGSAIRGMPFRPLTFALEQPALDDGQAN